MILYDILFHSNHYYFEVLVKSPREILFQKKKSYINIIKSE